MIFRTMLENGIFDSAFYINIDEAIDDTIERNEAAGRSVEVIKHTDRAVQFRINYPNINRTIDGTISPAPGAHTAAHEDSYVEVQQVKLLTELVDSPKELWIVPGADHNRAVEVAPSEYRQRLVRFLRSKLKTRGSELKSPTTLEL